MLGVVVRPAVKGFMSDTYRNVPTSWLRHPMYRWKLLSGIPRKQVVTDWDDKPVAAMKETRSRKTLRKSRLLSPAS